VTNYFMNVGQLMNIRPRSRPRSPIERSLTGAPAALLPAREDSAPVKGSEWSQPDAARASSGRTRAFLVGGLIFVLGLVASVFLAGEWRSNVTNSNRKSFQSTAADVTNTLDSKLDTTLELTRTMRAIAVMEPQAGDTRFREWYSQLRLGTSPSTGAVAQLIQPVTASALPAFRRQAEADPAFRALLKGPFQIVPSGRRPLYCLTRAIVGPATASSLYPPLLDYCDAVLPGIGPSPFAALVRTATDTNTNIVIPVPAFKVVAIGATVYRRGAHLATVAERRAAMTGVIGTSFDSTTLIASVLAGHQSLALALYHRSPGGPLELIGRAGAVSKGASPSYAEIREIGEGWLVVVKGTVPGAFSANTQGLFVLGLGLLVTVLGMLLYLVLVRSRRRAWGLVGEKTGELEYRALHDPLTDLPNRTLVLDRADQLLARARRLDDAVTALFVDIDDFKQINDRFGHRAGDEVLRRVGARMKTALRGSDTVGRLSGDEFVMLVDTAGLDVAPELVAERILDVLRVPIALPAPASSVAVTASIGIASGLSGSAEDLLADADLALYKAKAAGKDGYAVFEPSMQTAARDRMHLEIDLGEALEAEQFFLVYQPMFDLRDERLVGVEALLRWRHPSNGVIAPDVFIPIAEGNGSIVPIGRWVLEQACARGAAWQQMGHRLNIAVNVSARQLERSEFVEEVRSALQHSGLEPSKLTLEITETVLMRQPDATVHLLTELKALGVRIAVDDFGTGYSSLAYLRQFPVDLLKIDRTFITGLAVSGEAQALAHTLIRLGQALGLQTLAEGVEHHDQIRELRREGCDLVQGFLFARPLEPDAVETLLEDAAGRSAALAATRR
jgi:diguanylate cyclase (GGDEF)-like protein